MGGGARAEGAPADKVMVEIGEPEADPLTNPRAVRLGSFPTDCSCERVVKWISSAPAITQLHRQQKYVGKLVCNPRHVRIQG